MKERGEWGSRSGFVLAAIGSAVGLGNIWRFPYVVASNGGGAFMVVYLIALITAGIPIMILEFSIGHKFRSSAPVAFKSMNPKWEWLGWIQVFTSIAITVYYVAIIGWSLYYAFSSITGLAWGADTGTYFMKEYLQISSGPFDFGGIVTSSLVPLLIAWAFIYFILIGGIKGGIEKANKILMPILFAMVLIIIARGVSLPGALSGLDYMFKPDLSRIGDPSVWVAAYGQVFFSLSVAFAIMITYSSYLPKKSDINNNAFLASFADCGFSLLAGISVFTIIGYMAHTQGKEVAEVAGTGGIGLAFVVFPEAINSLPGFNGLFGTLFFLVLSFAGFTSAISINEVVIAAFAEKFHWSRKRAVTTVISITATISILFATKAGLHILDLVDNYVNNYNIVLAGLIEIVLIGWCYKLVAFKDQKTGVEFNDYIFSGDKIVSLQQHANSVSDFKIGFWWYLSLKYVTPIVLIVVSALKFKTNLTEPYSGYPQIAQLVFGWSMPILAIIFAIILSNVGKNKNINAIK